MNDSSEVPEKVSTLASHASYSTSAVTTAAGLSFNEWVALAGIVLGISTFVVNLWYKRAMLKIARNSAVKPNNEPRDL